MVTCYFILNNPMNQDIYTKNQDIYTKNQYFKNSCKKKFETRGYHIATERHGKGQNLS